MNFIGFTCLYRWNLFVRWTRFVRSSTHFKSVTFPFLFLTILNQKGEGRSQAPKSPPPILHGAPEPFESVLLTNKTIRIVILQNCNHALPRRSQHSPTIGSSQPDSEVLIEFWDQVMNNRYWYPCLSLLVCQRDVSWKDSVIGSVGGESVNFKRNRDLK